MTQQDQIHMEINAAAPHGETKPLASAPPSRDLSQLDRDIAAKQRAAPRTTTDSAGPGAAKAPGAYPAASLPAPGAYMAPPEELSQLDGHIAREQRAVQLPQSEDTLTGMDAKMPAVAKAAPSLKKPPVSHSSADSGMQAKDREKQLRREALSQRNLMGAAKPPPSSPSMKRAPVANTSADMGMQAKEREKQLRKQALSQRNLMEATAAAKPPPSSPSKKNPLVANPSADTGMQAKEREKHLRKEALSQRNLMAAGSAKPPPASPSQKAAPITVTSADTGMQAKEREKQLRKQALSQRNLMVAAAKPPPISPSKKSPSVDTGMQAKEQEKQLRKEAMSQRNLMGAAAAAAMPSPISPAKKSAPVASADAGMQAKEREKQLRREALNQQSPMASEAKAPAVLPSGPPKEVSQLDQDIAAKRRAVAPPATYPAAPRVYTSPPEGLSQLDRNIAAKQRVAPPGTFGVAPGAYAAPPEDLSHSDQDSSGREQASTSSSAPGAYSAPPDELSQLDRNIAAKQRVAAPGSFGAVPGAYSAPPDELSQLDRSIAAKQRVTPATAHAGSGAHSGPNEVLAQLDRNIAAKLRATAPLPVRGGSQEDEEQGTSGVTGNPLCPTALDCSSVSSVAQSEADLCPTRQVGAWSATRFLSPQKSFPGCSQNRGSREEFNDEENVEAAPSQPEQAPYRRETHTVTSYHLTQQPRHDVVISPPPLQEETVALTSHQLSPAVSTDNGLNLVEATLVVEEMVEATVATPMEFQEDEVMKIREQSAEETARIKMWRIIVSVALLATAVAVTTSTYMLLVEREDQNFRNVYYQFATTVADAAIEQQANIRDSLFSFADTVATMADVAGYGSSPWPYFIVDKFETLGRGFKSTSNAEFIAIQNLVTHDQRNSYVDFITPIYQDFVKEAHMEAYGHLENLNTDTSNYQPFIARKLSNGSFVPDIERDFYFARTTQSPPARKYGPTINNNLIANKVIGDGFAAVLAMHNESVFTPIKAFTNVPPDEHAKMHSNGAEGANNPHSFTFHPVHREAGNRSSDIVAMLACATAWDYSMLNLLPDNVKGMYCLVENTCNQTVTYRIDGGNATYLGEGELQPTEYDDMAVSVDLSLQVHPEARSTPGHCMYSMKIYPSKDFEDDYKTSTPAIYAAVVAGTFILIAGMLFIYDLTVTKRNEKMIFQAAKTNAILGKFVPDHLRDRIMGFDRRGDRLDRNTERESGSRASAQELNMSIMDMSKVEYEIDKSMAKSKMDASLSVRR